MAQQERARRTREKVLTAAAEVFAAQGYSRATLSSVAERTGMTKGALYGHFSSKDSLVEALVSESQQTWRSLRADYETRGADTGGALRDVVVDLVHRLHSDVRLRATVRLVSECPTLARSLSGAVAEVRRTLAELIRRAQQDSVVPAHSPQLVAQLLMTLMYGLLLAPSLYTEAEGMPDEQELWQLLFTVLSAEQGPAAAHGENGFVSGP
ncbi:TetR family transcriptional regulator [Streptomyces sp. NPDC004286]|uniref:TetR family transcriptional regulator n=1 Tax=Streptomyces sp. NPDC004286 TaxID=3364696 RepID=UPI00367FF1F4